MSLATLVQRLIADESFRLDMQADPERTLAEAGLTLNRAEKDALRSIPWDAPLSDLVRPGFFLPLATGWRGPSLYDHTQPSTPTAG